jgi:hypothetical protein
VCVCVCRVMSDACDGLDVYICAPRCRQCQTADRADEEGNDARGDEEGNDGEEVRPPREEYGV